MLLSVSTPGYRRLRKAEGPSTENPSVTRTPWYRTEGFHALSLAFSLLGSFTFIVAGMYIILLTGSLKGVPFVFVAILLLSFFFYLGKDEVLRLAGPVTAVPVRLESRGSLQALLGSSENEQAQGLDPERADLTPSVPTLLLFPREEQICEQKSKVSTEYTRVADSSQEERAQAATELPKQDVSQPSVTDDSSAATKLTEAVAVISQIVKETMEGKEVIPSSGETLQIEESSEKPSETESEGVRQRKITPMEPQMHISLPDDGKKE